jgi:Fe-S-cluster containining protein
MIAPDRIKEISKNFESENVKFRSFLKKRADSDELDAHFLKLHNELFADYDCNQCRNCCREYDLELQLGEVSGIAENLKLPTNDFIKKYITKSDGGDMVIKSPCCFLNDDGSCQLESCKPQSCIEFPYTDKPERLFSLLGVISFAEVCPVVFEIVQRLKQIYGFKSRFIIVS